MGAWSSFSRSRDVALLDQIACLLALNRVMQSSTITKPSLPGVTRFESMLEAAPATMAAPPPREAMSDPPAPAHGTPPSAPQQPPAPPPAFPNGTPPDVPPPFAELDVPGGPASLPPSHRHSTNLGFAREVERLHVGAPVMRAAEANRRLLHELAQRASVAPSSLSAFVVACVCVAWAFFAAVGLLSCVGISTASAEAATSNVTSTVKNSRDGDRTGRPPSSAAVMRNRQGQLPT